MISKRLPNKVFIDIYKKVPRLCVDLVIKNKGNVLLSKREILPRKGQWHLPGGTVLLHETLKLTARRVAKEETGLDIKIGKTLGFIEFFSDTAPFHALSVVLEVFPKGGKLRGSYQGRKLVFLKKFPVPIIREHRAFLKENKLIK